MIRALARAAALSLALPAAALAQAPQMPPPGGMMPGANPAQADMMKAMMIQQKLQLLHAKALEEPGLREKRDALHVAVKAAMAKKDPSVTAKIAQLEAMQKEAEGLQKAGNQEGLEKLAREGQALAMSLAGLEREVLQQPELSKLITELDTAVRAKMREINPKVAEMEAELQAIAQKMQAAQGGGLMMPPPQGQ
ncbi:MAG: hypothetical protein KC613_25675 [Myxococcales bacterium]|nr:hypothetical protein [Myxococcales bacterium]MCB9526350.1 hypothetical protein [Myxococcales bacterium]